MHQPVPAAGMCLSYGDLRAFDDRIRHIETLLEQINAKIEAMGLDQATIDAIDKRVKAKTAALNTAVSGATPTP